MVLPHGGRVGCRLTSEGPGHNDRDLFLCAAAKLFQDGPKAGAARPLKVRPQKVRRPCPVVRDPDTLRPSPSTGYAPIPAYRLFDGSTFNPMNGSLMRLPIID